MRENTGLKPAFDIAQQGGFAFDQQVAAVHGLAKCPVAHPDIVHGAHGRAQIDIHVLAGIGDAQIHLLVLNQQPPVLLFCKVAEFELDHALVADEVSRVDAALQVEHQEFDIDIGVDNVVPSIDQPPVSQRDQHGGQFLACLGRKIFVAALAGSFSPRNHPLLLERFEPCGQQRRRNIAQPPLQLVEAPPAHHELANDQESPALAKNFGCFGNWAELAVIHISPSALTS